LRWDQEKLNTFIAVMKNTFAGLLLLLVAASYAQVPAYYSGIDFSQTGLPLKEQLSDLVTSTHDTPISYDDVWNVLITSDLDPTNSAEVLLIYGYNDVDGSIINDRTRDKNNYGGSNGQWNREHVFAKSLGNPDLGTVGPGSDAHNLRSSDVQMNGDRGNLLFSAGSGNAGPVSSYWYPGDEWKGDCARIVMYMYLRYDLQCRPIYCVSGTANSVDANMVDILLSWNAADPVSEIEQNRNDIIQNWQGNRNPFIDNPSIATHIWGGPVAEDPWGGLGNTEAFENPFSVYPVPSVTHDFYIRTTTLDNVESVSVYDEKGALIQNFQCESFENTIRVSDVPSGTWIVSIQTSEGIITRKVIVL
jgi:endonuclease I